MSLHGNSVGANRLLRSSRIASTLIVACSGLALAHPVAAAGAEGAHESTPAGSDGGFGKASNGPSDSGSVDSTRRAEAARRFDRALLLFESGENAGALAEFKRAYEGLPDPVVLYNIGLVYAALARPVDAVDALDRVMTESNRLNPAQLQRAKQTLEDQRARVARLMITTKPPAARIEVDGIEVARTPTDVPIRVAEGKHVVGAVAEGYAPANKEIFVAGNSDTRLTFELIATQTAMPAHLAVRTRVPGVQVYIDGKLMGETPLAATIAAPPGEHSVELRRPGYLPVTEVVNVGAGATAEISLDPTIDVRALQREGATLVLQVSEAPAECWIDDQRQGFYQRPVRLPRGPHRLRVASPGFVPFEQEVALAPSKDNRIEVVLEPTAETRRSHLSSARFHRTWGWTGLVGGLAVTAGGAVLALIGGSEKSEGQHQLDAINAKFDNSEPPCDYRSGYASQQYSPVVCNQTISDAQGKVDAGNTLSTLGFIGMGVGGAAVATGLVLLLTGNDPHKYEHPPVRSSRAGASFALVPGPGQVGSTLRFAF